MEKLSDRMKLKMLRKKLNTACIDNESKLSDEVIQAWLEDDAMRAFRENDKRSDLEILKDALVHW